MNRFTRFHWITLIWLTIGYGTMHAFILMITAQMLMQPDPSEQYAFKKDGELIRSIYRPREMRSVYVDKDGKPLEIDSNNDLIHMETISERMSEKAYEKLEERTTTIRSYSDEAPQPTFWYQVETGDEPGMYFVGYAPLSRDVIGYVGRKGFSSELPKPDERFLFAQGSNRMLWNRVISLCATNSDLEPVLFPAGTVGTPIVYVAERSQVLEVNFRTHLVKEIYHAQDILSFQRLIFNGFHPTNSHWLIAHHEDKISLIDDLGKEQISIPIPKTSGEVLMYEFGKSIKDQLILKTTEDHRGTDSSSTINIWWMDKDKTIVDHKQMEISGEKTNPWTYGAIIAFVAPIPALILLIFVIGPYLAFMEQSAEIPTTLAQEYMMLWNTIWPVLLFMIPLMIVVAWLVSRYEKRHLGRVRIGWVIMIAFLGWPGLLAYWFHRKWTSLARDGKPMPLPPEPVEKTGTEILVSA